MPATSTAQYRTRQIVRAIDDTRQNSKKSRKYLLVFLYSSALKVQELR